MATRGRLSPQRGYCAATRGRLTAQRTLAATPLDNPLSSHTHTKGSLNAMLRGPFLLNP
ncbi:MAG: hypothetical protein IJV20_08180 [Prevotella sp.]|nr:hypothetical protein [Prevotella sp.]